MYIFHCQTCGKPVECTHDRSRYHFCSDECRSIPSIPVICQVCGKTFKATPYDYTRARFCSTDCRNAHLRHTEAHKHTKTATKTCERCGKEFTVRTSVAKVQRFCSQKCSGPAVMGPRRGPKNARWKPKITVICGYCNQAFETYPSREGRRNYCCKTHAILGNMKRFASGERTDIERAMSNALRKHRIAFDEQVVMFDKFMVDIKLTDYPIIIQCDGTYWHERTKVKVKDKGQDAYLTKAGYVVLRFNDAQILKNIDNCIRVIKAAIRNPSQPPLINY